MIFLDTSKIKIILKISFSNKMLILFYLDSRNKGSIEEIKEFFFINKQIYLLDFEIR